MASLKSFKGDTVYFSKFTEEEEAAIHEGNLNPFETRLLLLLLKVI